MTVIPGNTIALLHALVSGRLKGKASKAFALGLKDKNASKTVFYY